MEVLREASLLCGVGSTPVKFEEYTRIARQARNTDWRAALGEMGFLPLMCCGCTHNAHGRWAPTRKADIDSRVYSEAQALDLSTHLVTLLSPLPTARAGRIRLSRLF